MATSVVPVSISGGNSVGNLSSKSGVSVRKSMLTFQSNKPMRSQIKRDLSVRAEYNKDSSDGGDADFISGFVLGGAIFGTLGLFFGPKIRKALAKENEFGFTRPRRPVYYDEGVEKWQLLHKKIGQLNSALEKVSSTFRGGRNSQKIPVETKPEYDGFGETL